MALKVRAVITIDNKIAKIIVILIQQLEYLLNHHYTIFIFQSHLCILFSKFLLKNLYALLGLQQFTILLFIIPVMKHSMSNCTLLPNLCLYILSWYKPGQVILISSYMTPVSRRYCEHLLFHFLKLHFQFFSLQPLSFSFCFHDIHLKEKATQITAGT